MARNKTTYLVTAPDKQVMIFEFRWTISRGCNTYGYNICSLYVDGVKATSCNGGGYDMQGTCLGEWLTECYKEKLSHLTAYNGDHSKGFYGLSFWNKKTKKRQSRFTANCDLDDINVDGACGIESVITIAKRIGFKFEYKG